MARVIAEVKRPLAPGVVAHSDRPGVTASTDKLKGYVPPSEVDGSTTITGDEEDVSSLKRKLRDFVDLKTSEIEERRESGRYYHAHQWTEAELRTMEEQGRPDIVYNRVAKKINGVVGLLERLRQDPKAYPRTPAHEQGAEVATQCLRYALDACSWESQLSEVNLDLSWAGIGGWELSLDPTDDGSSDPVLMRVRPETFFYDPRSLLADFSDADFMGVAKWMRRDEAVAFLPDAKDAIDTSVATLSTSMASDADALDPDTENLWWDSQLKKLRIVETWYRKDGGWRWAIHTGTDVLTSGESPFKDGKDKSACRYIMQSTNVDEKGTRYGFVRNLKGAQDEINHRRSKALHAFNTKQVIIEEGIVSDVEKIRAEAHRVDGVISLPEGQGGKLRIESNTDVALANVQLLQDAKDEIENFGPNPALIGQGLDNKSGRAIALLQQSAIAELGPFIVRVRAMKLRCYSLVWEALRSNWTTPRFIRITDEEGLAGFLGINQPRMGPMGQQAGVENPIGKVVVDFVLDEGPDTVTLREDATQAIGQALSAAGAALPPPVMLALSRALMTNINLPSGDRKRVLAAFDQLEQPQQPNPMQQMAQQLELRGAEAKVKETEASTILKIAQAQKAGQPDMPSPGAPAEHPIETMSRVSQEEATTALRTAQARKTQVEADLAPLEFAHSVRSDLARAEEARSRQFAGV